MTISYTGDVANASSFGCFNKILLRWRGSVYKLIYKELLAYVMIYLIINIFYREFLVKNSQCHECLNWQESREIFESLCVYCRGQLTSIPLTFVLGFYVSLIVKRWWVQYSLLPWPDSMAIYLVAVMEGKGERVRLMKRNIIRYILLAYCMAMRKVSFRVKKRFPDLDHLVDVGLMRKDELKVMHAMDLTITSNKWFLPMVWAADICKRAMQEGIVKPQTMKCLIDEIVHIRNGLTGVMNHDWVSVPLVYTQVVTLAVYFYFGAALLGAQWISPETAEAYKQSYGLPIGSTRAKLDMFYPFFLTMQFAFYFGWLKVAETLINPFGEDDDDFELNRLIDRHTQVGYLIIDHTETPELLKDCYWDDCIPRDIPYTKGAEKFRNTEFQGSAETTLLVKEIDKEYGSIYQGPYTCVMPSLDKDLDDYEPIEVFRFPWAKKKDSISSMSSWTGSHKTIRKQSLYSKISRKLSLFDGKQDGRHRKTAYVPSRKKSCGRSSMQVRRYLNTITENQNSPHSTKMRLDLLTDKIENNQPIGKPRRQSIAGADQNQNYRKADLDNYKNDSMDKGEIGDSLQKIASFEQFTAYI